MKTYTIDETKFKVVPIEPTEEMTENAAAFDVEGEDDQNAAYKLVYRAMLAAASEYPADEAQQVTQPAWETQAKRLTEWKHCMSYSDSYFGEPAGLVKQVAYELDRLVGFPTAQPELTEAQEHDAIVSAYREAEGYRTAFGYFKLGWKAGRAKLAKGE